MLKALTERLLSRRSNHTAASVSAVAPRQTAIAPELASPQWQFATTPFSSFDALTSVAFKPVTYTPPAGNGLLMAASFGAFRPKVRFYWDTATFFEESENTPDNMPNKMVGITS